MPYAQYNEGPQAYIATAVATRIMAIADHLERPTIAGIIAEWQGAHKSPDLASRALRATGLDQTRTVDLRQPHLLRQLVTACLDDIRIRQHDARSLDIAARAAIALADAEREGDGAGDERGGSGSGRTMK